MSNQLLEQEELDGVALCGGNFETVIIDEQHFLGEIIYSIGGRKYIENAD